MIWLEGVLVSCELSSLGSRLCKEIESKFGKYGWLGESQIFMTLVRDLVRTVASAVVRAECAGVDTGADESSLGQRHRVTRIFDLIQKKRLLVTTQGASGMHSRPLIC